MSIIFSTSGAENIAKLSSAYSWGDPSVIKETKAAGPVIKTNAPPLMFVSIIPANIGNEEFTAQLIINRAKRTGIKIYAMNYSLHPAGKDVWQKPLSYVPSFRKLQSLLDAEPDIKLGILLQSTLGHGGYWNKTTDTSLTGQKMINADGSEDHRFCPFEKNFIDYITEAVSCLAELKPEFMIIDDDLRIPGKRCFCPEHLRRINETTGRNFTRQSLAAHLENAPAHDRTAQIFYQLNIESAGFVAKAVRRAIDKYDKSISCGYCIAAPQFETAVEVLKHAGTSKPMFLRLSNSYYLENAVKLQAEKDLLTAFQTINYSKQLDLPLIDESDTCPQDRFSKSARTMNLHIASGILHGCRGGKLWFDNSAVNVCDEFEKTFAEYHGLYRELAELMKQYTPVGAVTHIPPFDREMYPAFGHSFHLKGDWGKNVFGKMGLPAAYADMQFSGTHLLTGSQVDYYTDEELDEMLKGKVLIDGSAAIQLTKRGFSKKTGVHAVPGKMKANNEKILDSGIVCRFSSVDSYAQLTPEKSAEILSRICYNEQELLPGSVFFRNAAGGQVVSVSLDIAKTVPMNLLNPGRKIFFTDILEKLDAVPAALTAFQDAKLMCGVSKNGSMMWSVINYSYDPLPLEFATKKNITEISELMPDGSWKKLKFTQKNNKIIIARRLEPAEFSILILK